MARALSGHFSTPAPVAFMDDLKKTFRYETWANRRVLARLEELPGVPRDLHQRLAHILAGIRVWTMRLRGEDSTAEPIWPEWSLAECERVLGETERALRELEARLSAEFLGTEIAYTNQHGLSYTTAVRDILTHLALHGAYHRGQIAAALRALGHKPVNTDFITYVREEAGQPWRP